MVIFKFKKQQQDALWEDRIPFLLLVFTHLSGDTFVLMWQKKHWWWRGNFETVLFISHQCFFCVFRESLTFIYLLYFVENSSSTIDQWLHNVSQWGWGGRKGEGETLPGGGEGDGWFPYWSWYPPTLLFFIIFSSGSHNLTLSEDQRPASADKQCLSRDFLLAGQFNWFPFMLFSVKPDQFNQTKQAEERGEERGEAVMVKIMFCFHWVSEAPPPIFWCSWGICPILVRIGSEIDEGKKLPRRQPCRGRCWPELFDPNIC